MRIKWRNEEPQAHVEWTVSYMRSDEEQQTYQLHESTPLAVAEVPECQPELEPTQSLLDRGLGGEPPCSNGPVSSFGF
jgi:hypothetical protein